MAVGALDRKNTSVGIETHGRARDKARFCFFDMGGRHVRALQPCTTIHGHATITHGHHYPLVQFMWQLHMLTSLSTSPDSSFSVFNNLTTLMLLYGKVVSTSTSHC
ncbi:hypothetical protein GOBAR_AA08036 [Gossypium barbadense]|uniref:Uncharacterized protein n=1 Tax=Gossypium barbadense TaxID=3634 RepID=A0A2P5YAP1_GOSBA|nr:hypothetical protein GOBAR_AA08036 [Gossypium barbadense]